MSKQIQKSLQECISKIKILNKQIQFPACRHVRTASFAVEERWSDAATLADIDRFLFENFRSLYQKEYEEEQMTKESEAKSRAKTAYLFDSSTIQNSPPPENLCATDRFFVASGASSSQIVDEEACSSSTTTVDFQSTSEKADSAKGEIIVLLTQSRTPCEEFRRSMEEIVEAHLERNGKVDWEYLEELLLCYLDLNNKSSHKYVVQAFVDLVVVLRGNSWRSPPIAQPWNGGDSRRKLN